MIYAKLDSCSPYKFGSVNTFVIANISLYIKILRPRSRARTRDLHNVRTIFFYGCPWHTNVRSCHFCPENYINVLLFFLNVKMGRRTKGRDGTKFSRKPSQRFPHQNFFANLVNVFHNKIFFADIVYVLKI